MAVGITVIGNVLSDLRWDEGFSIPVSNAENKELENLIVAEHSSLGSLNDQVRETIERLNILKSHIAIVHQQLIQTLRLEDARRKELETEDHMRLIALQQKERIIVEIDKLNKRLDEQYQLNSMYENNAYCRSQVLEQCKTHLKWNEQALEAWIEEAAGKDQDAMVVEKYSRVDDAKIKELTLKISQRDEDLRRRRHQLDSEHTETLAAEMELEKTGVEFRSIHEERRRLVEHLEELLMMMRKRDSEIDGFIVQMDICREKIRLATSRCNEVERFYNIEKENNLQVVSRTEHARKQLASMKIELQETQQSCWELSNEIDVLRRAVVDGEMKIRTVTAELKDLNKTIVTKKAESAALQQMSVSLREKQKQIESVLMTTEQKVAMLDDTVSNEKATHAQLMERLQRQLELRHQMGIKLRNRNNNIKLLKTDCERMCLAIKNRSKYCRELEEENYKLEKVNYEQDMEADHIKRRIFKMRGSETSTEQMEMREQIKILTKELDDKKLLHKSFVKLQKKVLEDVRKYQFVVHTDVLRRSDIVTKLDELRLHLDQAARQLQKTIRNKQDLRVEANMVKLDVERLRRLLYESGDNIVTLEADRLHMEASIKDRFHLVSAHMQMLAAERHKLELDKVRINGELTDRMTRIRQLKNRYELLFNDVADETAAGCDDKPNAVVKVIVETVTLREDLRREGDVLDAKLRKATIELQALRNTLAVVRERNMVREKSFKSLPVNDEEADELKNVKEEYVVLNGRRRDRYKQLQQVREDLQSMTESLARVTSKEECLQNQVDKRQETYKLVCKEACEQKAKLNRSKEMNRRYSRELRCRIPEVRPEEVDFEVRIMCQLNKNALDKLRDAVSGHTEMQDAVRQHLCEAGIELSTTTSSVKSSITSSVSSSLNSWRLASKTSSSHSSLITDTGSSCSCSTTCSSVGRKGSTASSVSGPWR